MSPVASHLGPVVGLFIVALMQRLIYLICSRHFRRHIAQALADVPIPDRCHCKQYLGHGEVDPDNSAQATDASGAK